jgi:hypothetical protein
MPDHTSGVISKDEINQLVDLFRQFEGASDPLSVACREAEVQFNSLIEKLYAEKVSPHF